MACYDFEYAMQMLCQSIDFAETLFPCVNGRMKSSNLVAK